jgi:hypothetical protein
VRGAVSDGRPYRDQGAVRRRVDSPVCPRLAAGSVSRRVRAAFPKHKLTHGQHMSVWPFQIEEGRRRIRA